MNFIEATVTYFTRALDFRSRSSRSEYWWPMLSVTLIGGIIFIIANIMIFASASSGNMTDEQMLYSFMFGYGIMFLILIALSFPGIALSIRRFHDAGYSGWFYLLSLIPSVGSIIVLIMNGALETKQELNQWGPPPPHAN